MSNPTYDELVERGARALNILFGPFDRNGIGVEKIARTVSDAVGVRELVEERDALFRHAVDMARLRRRAEVESRNLEMP